MRRSPCSELGAAAHPPWHCGDAAGHSLSAALKTLLPMRQEARKLLGHSRVLPAPVTLPAACDETGLLLCPAPNGHHLNSKGTLLGGITNHTTVIQTGMRTRKKKSTNYTASPSNSPSIAAVTLITKLSVPLKQFLSLFQDLNTALRSPARAYGGPEQ